MKPQAFAFLLSLLSSLVLAADDDANDLQARFNEAYRTYKDTQSSPRSLEHMDAARSAYELGLELFPENESLAALAVNFGNVVLNDRMAGLEALRLAERIYTELYGPDATNLVDVYMSMGKVEQTSYDHRRALRNFEDAIELAAKHVDDNFVMANLHLEAAEFMVFYNNPDADRLGLEAIELYKMVPGQLGFEGQARAGRVLGNHYLLQNQSRKAIDMLAESLALAEEHNTDPHIQQLMHAMLGEYYQSRRQEEQATEHFQQIGRLKLLVGDDSMNPLIQQRPVYPPNALRRGTEGWVHVSFTVDENGLVQDPETVDYDGVREFESAAMTALKGFRFAPRFENGVPVKTQNVEYVFRFNMDG